MDWQDRLDHWEVELELTAQLEGSDWVTLERAAAETGASRAALRSWYRSSTGRTGRSDWCRSRLSPRAPRPRPGYGAQRNGGLPMRPS